MLYNPKWDVYSLDGLIAWPETKPPGVCYDYEDIKGNCLICRYLIERGSQKFLFDYIKFLVGINFSQHIASTKPWTYGDALQRAKAARDGG